jgi:hypothetical protein
MKKPTERHSVDRDTVERDLKALFRTEECLLSNVVQGVPKPNINLEETLRLFDESRAFRTSSKRLHEPKWTNPSVLTLGASDPVSEIVSRARAAVLKAIEQGWAGPPYNPFALAEMRGIKLLPTEEVLDARTTSDSKGRFTTEFNPQRAPARMRYSIAHEIGHTLFDDCAAATRNRATHQEMKDDDWQLESLCNIAAAEILIPFGTLHDEMSMRPSVGLILSLRRKYLASCEAVANRLIRLSAYPCFAFLARLSESTSRYFVEYRIVSPALQEQFAIHRGYVLPPSSKAASCTAIGARDQEDAHWVSSGKEWFVEYLGISPNTGETFPRVLGLAFPPLFADATASEPLKFLPGDASEPFGANRKILLQVVNDGALIWGGGFAKQARKKWPQAQVHFRDWAQGHRNLKLGNIHSVDVREDLTLVSLVAQHGFGKPDSGPRLRYGALFSALEKVAALASTQQATVHMPRIGTGEAGGSWNVIEGIIRETLVARGIEVRIYDLYPRGDEPPKQPSLEFPQKMADELI